MQHCSCLIIRLLILLDPCFQAKGGLIKATLSASQSVCYNHFFSKTARIFVKLYIKFWFLKDKKVTQPGKNLVLGKKPEISIKLGFFGFGYMFIPLIGYFWVCMIHHTCLYDSAKTACFGKISFSSYEQKCSRSIRLQFFFQF